MARQDGAPGVGGRCSCSACLVAGNEIVSLGFGGAASVKTVDIGNVEVVHGVLGVGPLEEVFQLDDVVALALVCLGDLDGDADVSAIGLVVVLAVCLARVERDHLGVGAAVAFQDGPKIDGVVASVDDTGIGFAVVALLGQGHGAPGRGSCDHGGGGRKEGDELHGG